MSYTSKSANQDLSNGQNPNSKSQNCSKNNQRQCITFKKLTFLRTKLSSQDVQNAKRYKRRFGNKKSKKSFTQMKSCSRLSNSTIAKMIVFGQKARMVVRTRKPKSLMVWTRFTSDAQVTVQIHR